MLSASLTCFLSVGAVLPVLPRYVTGPLGGGDVEVGLVTGAFAFTALVARPFGGRLADRRGRRPVAIVGMALAALSALLYLVPLGVPGLIGARLVLGVGQGWVFTAGLAWTVDLAPRDRRGQAIAYYGLGVWGGLSFGPLLGEALLRASSYEVVWLVAAALPLVGVAIASRVHERADARPAADDGPGGLLPREAVRPGTALLCASLGYAALAGFVVLHLDELGVGHGAAVFTAFATTVVVARLLLAWLPDRVGARTTAIAAGIAQAIGLTLIAVTQGLPLAIAGALAMGAGFSLSFPSLALLVVERVSESRRGAAMGAFTAFFDLGVGIGAPVAGAISALAGYPAAFGAAAALAAVGAVITAVSASGPRKLGPSDDVSCPIPPSPGPRRR